MTITKAEISDTLVDTMGLSNREAKEIIETFFDGIRKTLASGEEVKISGFGNFAARDKRARPGRNPMTGEPIPIMARRVVLFHPSAILREHCNPELASAHRKREPRFTLVVEDEDK